MAENNTLKGGNFVKGAALGAFVLAFLIMGVLFAWQTITGATLFGSTEESRSEMVVRSLTKEEEIVLLSLGIQGITEENISTTVFGKKMPGTTRTQFLQYNYNAKLGIDGSEVKIEQTDEDSLTITLPPFEFLGHDDAAFKTVVEDNGILSFTTPDIDTASVITKILNDETRRQHIAANDEILRSQAEAFYTGIIESVDPDIDVEFKFTTFD